jgi:hypothetical protein
MKKIHTKTRKILVFATISIVVVCASIGTVLYFNRGGGPTTTGGSGVNLNPPTEQDKKETAEFKKALEDKLNTGGQSDSSPSPAPAPNTDTTPSLMVTLSYISPSAQTVQAGGYLTGILEDNGTCTLTLTKGSLRATGTSTGFIDVNKTTCPQISIERSQLSQSGQWTAVLSYKSTKASGASAPQAVNIP